MLYFQAIGVFLFILLKYYFYIIQTKINYVILWIRATSTIENFLVYAYLADGDILRPLKVIIYERNHLKILRE